MAWDRSRGRNVHIFFGNNEDPSFGLVIPPDRPHITRFDLYRYLDILVLPDDSTKSPQERASAGRCFKLNCKRIVRGEVRLSDYPPDSEFVEPQTQLVLLPWDSTGTMPFAIPGVSADTLLVPLKMNMEPFIGRHFELKNPNIVDYFSPSPQAPDSIFNRAVQQRDTKCVFSQVGTKHGPGDEYYHCQSVQVFPLAAKELWVELDGEVRNCITNYRHKKKGKSKHRAKHKYKTVEEQLMMSQNGLWLLEPIKAHFERFRIGVDPDANYKIIVFRDDEFKIAGKTMHRSAWHSSQNGVPSPLLRWHLRMCILANMRGKGEPLVMYDDGEFRREGIMATLNLAMHNVLIETRGQAGEQAVPRVPEREEKPEVTTGKKGGEKPSDLELTTIMSSKSTVSINRPNLPR